MGLFAVVGGVESDAGEQVRKFTYYIFKRSLF